MNKGQKWITFDLDGTLMQNPFKKWVFPEIAETLADEIPDADIIDELVREHSVRMGERRYREAYDWDDMLNKVAACYGASHALSVERMVKQHSVVPKVYLLEEGIREVLRKLSDKGYALGIITNGLGKYQLPVLETLQLKDHFAKIVTPDHAGYAKPDLRTADPFTENGDELVAHVGDRVDHDVYFANRLGCLSFLIDRDMPEQVRCQSPKDRTQNESYVGILKEKWSKGNHLTIQIACEEITPSAALCTLEELPGLL
ncbi:MAG TPA: HAD family hydrolase [Bacillales bacterium]|nr:HAD family hydrolase [Bacillales bacterium]